MGDPQGNCEDSSFGMEETAWKKLSECLEQVKLPPMPEGNWLFLAMCLRLVAGCLTDRVRREMCWRLRVLLCFYMADGLRVPEKKATEN